MEYTYIIICSFLYNKHIWNIVKIIVVYFPLNYCFFFFYNIIITKYFERYFCLIKMKKIEKEIKTFDDDDNDEYKFIYKTP